MDRGLLSAFFEKAKEDGVTLMIVVPATDSYEIDFNDETEITWHSGDPPAVEIIEHTPIRQDNDEYIDTEIKHLIVYGQIIGVSEA